MVLIINVCSWCLTFYWIFLASAEHWGDSFRKLSVITQVSLLSCNFKIQVQHHDNYNSYRAAQPDSCLGVVALVYEMPWCIRTESMGEQDTFWFFEQFGEIGGSVTLIWRDQGRWLSNVENKWWNWSKTRVDEEKAGEGCLRSGDVSGLSTVETQGMSLDSRLQIFG